MIVSIETEYYLGDEILYETTAIRDKVIVPVFMLSKIQSITISCPNYNREYSLEYEIDDGRTLKANEIKCIYNNPNSAQGLSNFKFKISFDSPYCIMDEILYEIMYNGFKEWAGTVIYGHQFLYETTAIKERIVTSVFMAGRIKSIKISPLEDNNQIAIKYILDDGNVINPDDIRGYLNGASNLF